MERRGVAVKTVMHLLQSKPSQAVHTITPAATVLEAITLMADKGIGALVVTEGERVVGIVSERDYARKVVLRERSSYDTAVSDIMSSQVVHVGPDQSTEQCMTVMTERRLRHLPVLDESQRLIGLVSIGDLVKAVIEDQQLEIEQLQQYIAS